MRKLLVVAALALISSSADAKVHNLNFGGRSVRVEVPAGCKRISCVTVIEKARSSRRGRKAADPETAAPATSAAPAPATSAIPVAAAPAAAAATTAAVTAAVAARKPEAKKIEAVPPLDERRPVSRLTLPNNEPSKPAQVASAPNTEPSKPTQVIVLVPSAEPSKPAQVTSVQTGSSQDSATEPKSEAASSSGATPVGLWDTEKRDGKVRIVECGQALCGHLEGMPDKKVLVNMQPGQNNRWNGKVNDLRRGGTYVAHMSLRNPNSLRVEGCAMGGMFCGGETWTRAE